MAQLGARLIDASARQMADQFFDRFTEILSPPTETGAMAEQAAERRAAPAAISVFDLIPKQPFGFPLVFWIGGLIWLFIFIMIFGSYL